MLLNKQIKQLFSLASSFTVLGMKSTTNIDEVKKKYIELAKKYHPDLNKDNINANSRFA